MPLSNQAVLNEFVSEAREHLATVAADLLALEQSSSNDAAQRLDRLFRAMHSVKGGAGLTGCKHIGALAHALETLFDRIRQGLLPRTTVLTDALLAGNDLILTLLDDVAGSDGVDIGATLARLQELLAAPPPVTNDRLAADRRSAGLRPAVKRDNDLEPPPPEFSLSGPWLSDRPSSHLFLYTLRVELHAHQLRSGRSVLGFLADLHQHACVLDARLIVPDHDLTVGLPDGPVTFECLCSSALPLVDLAGCLHVPAAAIAVIASPSTPPEEAPEEVSSPPADDKVAAPIEPERPTTVRINVQILDRLMNLAGELVLVRNQAVRVADPADTQLRQVVQRLNAVTTGVQQAVMLTRMQPVSNLFGKFPRLVRDLAKQLGKQIELTTRGTEVELDKAILESLSDPLTHLVRNCCDHGIESPAERIAEGKPPLGHVLLHAHHEGGQIRLEVRDDGRGIDPERVRRKALARGLKSAAELAAMSAAELQALVLLPGFSTAEQVTEVSGRGVGMDVVKTNLEQLGGSLQIESSPGTGTSMHLRLPLTLAIIPCLIVTAGGQRYAIAQKDLEELVCLDGERAGKVEIANDQEVYRLRNRLLPLVRLSEVLARPTPFDAAARAEILRTPRPVDALVSFTVVKVGNERFGLVIDEFLNTEEIVVKPMHPALKRLRIFSGATIMGDGQVTLILDIEGIFRHARVPLDTTRPSLVAASGEEMEKQTVLLFQYGPREQFAVPLVMIRRIEEVRVSRFERVGDREFVTLQGRSVRVLRLDQYLRISPAPEQEVMYLLLPKNLKQPVGILLSRLLDTHSLSIQLDADGHREDGIMGTAIVGGRMTLFLDLFQLADRLDAEDKGTRPSGPTTRPARRRILLVEDTQFFRQVVSGYLEQEGYEVVTAVNGALGLRELTRQPFDLVVSDIEMPQMDGWSLARAVREQLGRRDLPLLALTTLNSERDRQRAVECGFNGYEVKVDRESLLATVAHLLANPPGGGSSHG
jgi:two-component system chemotaxis sensor kinase CheA